MKTPTFELGGGRCFGIRWTFVFELLRRTSCANSLPVEEAQFAVSFTRRNIHSICQNDVLMHHNHTFPMAASKSVLAQPNV